MTFTIKLREKLKQKSTSTKERWFWFIGLYAISVITIIAIMTLLHGLVAMMILI